MEDIKRIRVAFVPLETTFIGLPRALLFNMMYRDSCKGKIILRIDDTDKSRARQERLKTVFDTLHWLGINWDEGPDIGGLYPPYIQSERTETYKDAAKKLIEQKKAYHCFCKYTDEHHGCVNDCYNLTPKEVDTRINNDVPFCVRFRLDHSEQTYTDLVHGTIHSKLEDVSDPVIIRNDGSPTFHLATAVDEGALHITHILRGVDHIESAFIQLQLMDSLNVSLPQYLHFSIFEQKGLNIYNDNLKGQYDAEYLRNKGFLAKAIVNFLITSGYQPKNVEDCSLYSYSDFLKSFSIKNFSKSNQQYDYMRLLSLNKKWIHHISNEEFISIVKEYFIHIGYDCHEVSDDILIAFKKHIEILEDLKRKIDILYDDSLITKNILSSEVKECIPFITYLIDVLGKDNEWTESTIKSFITQYSGTIAIKQRYECLRHIITLNEKCGSILELISLMGKNRTLARLNRIYYLINHGG